MIGWGTATWEIRRLKNVHFASTGMTQLVK